MPIMTRKEEEILDKLMRLAQGDPRLVERALKECSQEKAEPDLKDIVAYIKRHVQRTEPHAA